MKKRAKTDTAQPTWYGNHWPTWPLTWNMTWRHMPTNGHTRKQTTAPTFTTSLTRKYVRLAPTVPSANDGCMEQAADDSKYKQTMLLLNIDMYSSLSKLVRLADVLFIFCPLSSSSRHYNTALYRSVCFTSESIFQATFTKATDQN